MTATQNTKLLVLDFVLTILFRQLAHDEQFLFDHVFGGSLSLIPIVIFGHLTARHEGRFFHNMLALIQC